MLREVEASHARRRGPGRRGVAEHRVRGPGRAGPRRAGHPRRDQGGRPGARLPPNGLARGLRTGRTFSIGLHQLGPDRFAAQYTREFAAGAIEVVHHADYDLTLLATDTGQPRARQPQVDGIIIADPIANDIRARDLLESGIPVIAGEHYPLGMPSSPVIAVDHATAVRGLLDHAYERGARRPLLVGPDGNSGWGTVLHAVYSAWCAERGLTAGYRAVDFIGRLLRRRGAAGRPRGAPGR